MATDCTDGPLFEPSIRRALRRRLLGWYAEHERDLPWRRNRDPYRVWVSEIMLQQTQVATVQPYFERFVDAFPNVDALAAASEEQVLKLWEGLGYYRRARQMHAAAQVVVSQYAGQMPRDVGELQKLPGIGRYTAGAIASIAFDERAPILEANTLRLLSRLIGYREDPTKAAGQALLWRMAAEILPRREVARFNQALMELGSLVCRPLEPGCNECPLADVCTAYADGAVEKIPAASKKLRYTSVREAAVVVHKNGSVLLRRCADGERWAGLWDFPRFECDAEGPLFARDELIAKVRGLTGVTCRPGSLLKSIKHGVTRYRITLDCYSADYSEGRVRSTKAVPVRWVACDRLADYPLSTTGRQLARLVTGGAAAGE